MAELTPSRRSQLLQQLLQQMGQQHRGTRTGGEALARLGTAWLQKKQYDKLTKEEAEGQKQLSEALAQALPGTDTKQLEAIMGDEGDPLEVTNVRRKGDPEKALAAVLALPGELRSQGLNAMGALNQVQEPGFKERTEIQTEAQIKAAKARSEMAAELEEAGWERQQARDETYRRFQLEKQGRDQQWRSQESFLDRNFRAVQNEEDRKLKRLGQEAAGGLDLNQDQSKAMLYGVRAYHSDTVLDSYGSEFTGLDTRAAKRMMNGWKDSKRQEFEQARRNFINATLRRESGAVISDQEFENAEQQYIPQPGDSKENLARKSENRRTFVEGMKMSSGGGFDQLLGSVGSIGPQSDKADPEEGLTATGPNGEKMVKQNGVWVRAD